MAAGRTSRPRSGLCVVINGNLKQRELTISFFISSPMLRAQERPRRTRPGAPRTHTGVPCKHTYAAAHVRRKRRRRSHLEGQIFPKVVNGKKALRAPRGLREDRVPGIESRGGGA